MVNVKCKSIAQQENRITVASHYMKNAAELLLLQADVIFEFLKNCSPARLLKNNNNSNKITTLHWALFS